MLKHSVKHLNIETSEKFDKRMQSDLEEQSDDSPIGISWEEVKADMQRRIDNPTLGERIMGIYYFFYWKINHTYWAIRYFIQRHITQGYADPEAFGLHYYASQYILPRLKAMRGDLHGSPADLEFEEWEKVIDEIIWSLQRHLEYQDMPDGVYFPKTYSEEQIAEGLRMDKGFELMGKYWADLWD